MGVAFAILWQAFLTPTLNVGSDRLSMYDVKKEIVRYV